MDEQGDEGLIKALMQDMRLVSDAELERRTRDESSRQAARDAARRVLEYRATEGIDVRELIAQEERLAADRARADRAMARQRAKAIADDSPDQQAASPATGQRRGSERLSRNQPFAERFADALRNAGHVATARPTQRVQGREVIDGWAVNVRDNENEAGVVAVWWGRAHFSCYFEMNGHADRTAEAAVLMVAVLDILKSETGTED